MNIIEIETSLFPKHLRRIYFSYDHGSRSDFMLHLYVSPCLLRVPIWTAIKNYLVT